MLIEYCHLSGCIGWIFFLKGAYDNVRQRLAITIGAQASLNWPLGHSMLFEGAGSVNIVRGSFDEFFHERRETQEANIAQTYPSSYKIFRTPMTLALFYDAGHS